MAISTCSSRQNYAGRKTPKGKTRSCRGARAERWRLTQTPLQPDQSQSKPRIEFPAVVFAATGQTCNCAFDWAYPRKIALASWAPVKIAPGAFADRKREVMTTLLVAYSKIATSLLPFNAMRQNPTSAHTKLRQDMRQLVSQSPFDLVRMFIQLRI